MDKIRVLGFVDKTTGSNKYGLVSVEKYFNPQNKIDMIFTLTSEQSFTKDALTKYKIMNYVTYDNNGTRHALIMPVNLYKGFEQELVSDSFMICYGTALRQDYDINRILKGFNKQDIKHFQYVGLQEERGLGFVDNVGQAAEFSGFYMLKAIQAIMQHSKRINNILIVNKTKLTAWQVAGY